MFELPEEYVPRVSRPVLIRNLARLPIETLRDLILYWNSRFQNDLKTDNDTLKEELDYLVSRKVGKKNLAIRVVDILWPKGLNLLQLAQLDCHWLVENQDKTYWNSSTAWNASGQRQILNIEPDKFIRNIKDDLGKFFLSHIHIFQHPTLPLIICRIQLYSYNNAFVFKTPSLTNLPLEQLNKSELISRRPYYVAILQNAPSILHSADNDIQAELILQSIERTISEREPVVLRTNEKLPVRSLDAMYILYGSSRHSEALGPWKPYADASFDISPLSKDTEKHISLKQRRQLIDTHDKLDRAIQQKKLKMTESLLRFKGSENGDMVNMLYDIQRKTSNPSNQTQDDDAYASIVPVEKVEFFLYPRIPEDAAGGSSKPWIELQLSGKDVFAGLHELCDQDKVDIERVPNWLAGENGPKSGIIKNGQFCALKPGNNGLL